MMKRHNIVVKEHDGWMNIVCTDCNEVLFHDDIDSVADRVENRIYVDDLMQQKAMIAPIQPYERTEQQQYKLSELNTLLDQWEFIPLCTTPDIKNQYWRERPSLIKRINRKVDNNDET